MVAPKKIWLSNWYNHLTVSICMAIITKNIVCSGRKTRRTIWKSFGIHQRNSIPRKHIPSDNWMSHSILEASSELTPNSQLEPIWSWNLALFKLRDVQCEVPPPKKVRIRNQDSLIACFFSATTLWDIVHGIACDALHSPVVFFLPNRLIWLPTWTWSSPHKKIWVTGRTHQHASKMFQGNVQKAP